MALDVEWDEAKAADVARERGIAFEDAATIFLDPLAITIPDVGHSTLEERYATIGTTRTGRLLVVIHVDRGRRVRLITAWPATPAERRTYEAHPRR
jgi:uncharacterized protein